ncbi:hypothetical protein GGR53DRAFT_526253 [Hypoxylon sp. FL1150]|nr:hypothetical protein GGR53DRAFT_526253 [Hypoxylon sp. FL1150]
MVDHEATVALEAILFLFATMYATVTASLTVFLTREVMQDDKDNLIPKTGPLRNPCIAIYWLCNWLLIMITGPVVLFVVAILPFVNDDPSTSRSYIWDSDSEYNIDPRTRNPGGRRGDWFPLPELPSSYRGFRGTNSRREETPVPSLTHSPSASEADSVQTPPPPHPF